MRAPSSARIRLVTTALLSLSAGCFAPGYKSGDLQCGVKNACPPSFYCAADNRCYRAGAGPDLGAGSNDLGAGDGGAGDLGTPVDMYQPPIVVPPAAVFVSCGGGSSSAASGTAINLSFPGVTLGGTVTAASGASVSYGYFSNASVQ